MRESIILKLLALDRMIRKCEYYRSAKIKDLQQAPSWYPLELLVSLENRITAYNQMIVRLERYYQTTLTKLQKL